MAHIFSVGVLLALLLASSSAAVARAPVFTVLHHFTGNTRNGGDASQAALAIDKSGDLFGTTLSGGLGTGCGPNNCGTAFKMTKPPAGQTAWVHSVIHHFTGGADGTFPFGSLVIDASGALTGTTNIASGTSGLVYRLKPAVGGKWTFEALYGFKGGKTDGAFPSGEVLRGAKGVLYVTASEGGAKGKGTVQKLTPPATGSTFTSQTLVSFAPLAGARPTAGLIANPKGVLYGTTAEGGRKNVGVLFSLAPPASGTGRWTYTVLHQFARYPTDGQFGQATLLRIGATLYGTTVQGGANDVGTIFSFRLPTVAQPAGVYKVLHSFDFPEGTEIYSKLVVGADGALYGVASSGGANNKGSIYRFKPASAGSPASFSVLHSFAGRADGEAPYGGLATGADGTLYGTTSTGGRYGFGTVFSIKP